MIDLFFIGPGKLPTKGHPDDAGFDLYVHGDVQLRPQTFTDVDCGVNMELPVGLWALITGRSSAIRQRGLLVVNGVIDCGYRGRLFGAVWNMNDKPVVLQDGDRITQLLIFPNVAEYLVPVRVNELSQSERGEQGFGSTGR